MKTAGRNTDGKPKFDEEKKMIAGRIDNTGEEKNVLQKKPLNLPF